MSSRRTRNPQAMKLVEHALADDYIALCREIESLQAQQKIMRKELQRFAEEVKDCGLALGRAHLSIRIVGPERRGSVVFSWRESYSSPKISDTTQLVSRLGGYAARFTKRYERVSLDKGVTLSVLKKVIGKHALDALVEADIIDVTSGTIPAKGAMAGIAECYSNGDEDAAAALEALVMAHAPQPQCKTKHPVAGGVKHAAK